MKAYVMNKECQYVEISISLNPSDISEVYYEDRFTRSGEDNSYFNLYLDTDNHKDEYDYINKMISHHANLCQTAAKYFAWFEVKIPSYDDNKVNHELAECKLYFSGENEFDEYCQVLVDCELTDDEKQIIINTCIDEFKGFKIVQNW